MSEDSVGDQIAQLQRQLAELRGDTTSLAAALDRDEALEYIVSKTALHGLIAIRQRGGDQGATYALVFDTGEEIRVGTVGALLSQAELDKILFPSGRTLPTIKRADWKGVTTAMLAIREILEVVGERFCDIVAEWIDSYRANATTDKAGAIPMRAPYIEDGRLCLHAPQLARYVRREFSEQVKMSELYEALSDLGYTRVARHFVKSSGERSTVSYYQSVPQKPDSEPS